MNYIWSWSWLWNASFIILISCHVAFWTLIYISITMLVLASSFLHCLCLLIQNFSLFLCFLTLVKNHSNIYTIISIRPLDLQNRTVTYKCVFELLWYDSMFDITKHVKFFFSFKFYFPKLHLYNFPILQELPWLKSNS